MRHRGMGWGSGRALLALVLVVSGCSAGGGIPASGAPQSGGPVAGGQLPTTLTFTAEPDATVEGTVTLEAGGTVSATAADGSTFELIVPAEAVADDTVIRMTPLTDVRGMGDGPVHAVQLGPEGLAFHQLVRLRITPSTAIPPAQQLVFEAHGDGTAPELALVDPAPGEIVILLEHFTIEGVASASPGQIALFKEKSATNAEQRIKNELDKRIQEERARDGSDEAGKADVSDLFDEYDREVIAKRREAAMQSCANLKAYIRAVVTFERNYRQLMGTKLTGATAAEESASQARINEALAATEAKYQECEKEAIAECRSAKDPSVLTEFWLAMERPADKARADRLCKPQGLTLVFSKSDIPIPSLAGSPTDNTTDIAGRVIGCLKEDGGWSFTGTYTDQNDYGAPEYTGDISGLNDLYEGVLIDMTGTQSPDAITMSLGDPRLGTPALHQQRVDRVGYDETLRITDALGTPKGSVTFFTGFGDKIGDFDVDVTKADPECPDPAP